MCDNLSAWQNVLVKWINCLALQETPIQQISELGDGRFFQNLLNVISSKIKHGSNTDQVNEELTTFLKHDFPNYCMDAESCEVEDVIEITYITSLLLLHCVLRSQNKMIMECMCNLDEDTQVSIKKFFEIILPDEGNITRNVLKQAISEHVSISPRTPGVRNRSFDSPLIGLNTPKRPPIKDVVESPLAQKIKLLSEQRAMIKRLNDDLELEQMEKVQFQEEIRQQREKTKKLAKQLSKKNEEIKKLREEWLHSDSELQQKTECDKSCQEMALKSEIKCLESYISSVHGDMESLQKERDLLEQRITKAEHQYNVWHTKSQEYEAQCEKLQCIIGEKELELAHVKELCSELQSHIHGLKETRHTSIEEDDDTSVSRFTSPTVNRTPENLGKTVVDLQLREREEENRKLGEQLQILIMEEEQTTRHMYELEHRLEAASKEAGSLKISNIELERKVDILGTLQHELEESERKLNSTSVELEHLSQARTLLGSELVGLQDIIADKTKELSDSHIAMESLTSTIVGLEEKFQETQKLLADRMEHIASLEHEAQETQKQLNLRSQEAEDMQTENLEVKQNLNFIGQQLERIVKQVQNMLSIEITSEISPEVISHDNILRPDEELEESLSTVCFNVKSKVQKLNILLSDLDSKNVQLLHEQSSLESTCKQLNENIAKLQVEITDLEGRELNYSLERKTLKECLEQAEQNITVLQTRVSEYTLKIEDLKTALKDKIIVIESIETVKMNLSDKVEKLEMLEEESTGKLKVMQVELMDIKQDKIVMQDHYNKLKEFSEEQSCTVNMLNSKVAALNKEIQNLMEERNISDVNQQKVICELQEVQASKEHLEEIYYVTMQESEAAIKNLNDQLIILKNKICELENRIAIADEELESVKENLSEMSKNRDILKLQYDIENKEKTEQIELLNHHARSLKEAAVRLEEDKKNALGKLETMRENLSETIIRNKAEVEKLDASILDKEEYTNNLKTTMENEMSQLKCEKESLVNALEVVRAELLEMTVSKNDLEMLCKEQNEKYKVEFANLSDKLTVLSDNIESTEQEKVSLDNELESKKHELTELKNSYENLLGETKHLEITNGKQLEQLKNSTERIEVLVKEIVIVKDKLTNVEFELSEEKLCKELLSEELSEKNNNLNSVIQESNNFCNAVKLLENERNLLQNNLEQLTSKLVTLEMCKDELFNLKTTMENEMSQLKCEKESLVNALEVVRAELLEVTVSKNDVEMLCKEQNETYKVEFANLSDKLTILSDNIESTEQEKVSLDNELESKKHELTELKNSYENLLAETKHLEITNGKQLEELKNSTERIEVLVKEIVIVKDKLTNVEFELSEEKLCKELLSEELSEKNNNLNSVIQESNNFCNAVKLLENERNLLQNNFEQLTSKLVTLEMSKDELFNLKTTMENEMSQLKCEKESLVNALEVVRTELLEMTVSKNDLEMLCKEQNEKYKVEFANLSDKLTVLSDNIESTEQEKVSLDNELESKKHELTELKNSYENLLAETKHQEITNGKQLEQLKNSTERIEVLVKEIVIVKDKVTNVEFELSEEKLCKELLSEELSEKNNNLNSVIQESNNFCNAVKMLENERNLLQNNLEQLTSKLVTLEMSKDELFNLKTTMENEMSQLKCENESLVNALEVVRAELLEVTVSKNDLEMLNKEQNEKYKVEFANLSDKLTILSDNIESTEQEKVSLDNELESKKHELTELKNSYENLLEETKHLEITNGKQLEELKNSTERIEVLVKEIVIVKDKLTNVEFELSEEKLCKELLSEELSEKNNNLNSVIQESNNFCNAVKLLENERNLLQNNLEQLTSKLVTLETNKDELFKMYNSSESEREKVIALKMGLELKIDNLETEKSCISNERAELCTQLQTANFEISDLKNCKEKLLKICDTSKNENEELEIINISMVQQIEQMLLEKNNVFKEFESVKALLLTLQESKTLLNEKHCEELLEKEGKIDDLLKEKICLQKLLDQTVEEKNIFDINLNLTNAELLNVKRSQDELLESHTKQLQEIEENIKSAYKDAIEVKAVLSKKVEEVEGERDIERKLNLELNQKLQKYNLFRLKSEEECLKLVGQRQERELEFEKLLNSETTLEQKMFHFQKSLKDIGNKFETLVSDTSISYSELRVIECQKFELEELFILMDIECEEISHAILSCMYSCLKQTEQSIERQCLLPDITIASETGEQSEPSLCDLNIQNPQESEMEQKITWQQQGLVDLQLQIKTLISGIDIAMKKFVTIDTLCNKFMKMYNTKRESVANISESNEVFENLRNLGIEARTNLIKDIVVKLQCSVKKQAELEMEEDGWNPEDSLEMNSGTKDLLSTYEDEVQEENDGKQVPLPSAILKMRLCLGEEIECLKKKNKSVQILLEDELNLKADLEKDLTELRILHETLSNDKDSACKLKCLAEEKCSQLESEILKTAEIKQAYESLLEDNYKLQSENEDMKNKLEEKMKTTRQEYEGKLERLKAKMRVLYEEEVEKKTKKSKEEIEHLQAMCRLYKDKITSYDSDVGILKSQVWEIGDKLLITEKEKKRLEEELSKHEFLIQTLGKQKNLSERLGTQSLERGRKPTSSCRDINTMNVIDESIICVRRKKSVQKSVPTGMGHMFNPEDEEGEFFNTTNLADLKAGRCVPLETYKGRISELQYRNSLCPPHLKSSYPAETQFHDPREYKDEELKLGCAVDVDQCDVLSTSMLLPSEKQRKKDRGQTSYKKPGPPTPGKNGGRLSLQGSEVLTPRAPLRESNDGACVRKASTPSRLKSLFTNKNRRDEDDSEKSMHT